MPASWIGLAIQAAGTLYGANQGRKAGKKAKKGARAQIEFAKESRDLARADTKHARQAGAKALNALQRMTGLKSGMKTQYDPETGYPVTMGNAVAPPADVPAAPPADLPPNDPGSTYDRYLDDLLPWMGTRGNRISAYSRAYGGAITPRQMYNINEMGPENVYAGGAITRNPNPMTIDGKTGYVEPNIEGRYTGGVVGMSNPQTPILRDAVAYRKYSFDEDQGLWMGPRGNVRKNQPSPPPGYVPPPMETDIDTTQGEDFQWQADPGYQFRFEEGQRALDRSAAARGGLLSGGFARKAMRYGQGFASNEYTNVYNRIAGIAGMGQVANQHAGGAALQGGYMMGQGAMNAGAAGAYGAQLQGNAVAGGMNQIAQLPWGQMDWSNPFARANTNSTPDLRGVQI